MGSIVGTLARPGSIDPWHHRWMSDRSRSTPSVITASAPVRVCDLGGWTDTWFGGPGRVLNLAVQPGVTVEVGVSPGSGRAHLDLVGFGEKLTFEPGRAGPVRHPLLEAAVARVPPPSDVDLDVRIDSSVPPG